MDEERLMDEESGPQPLLSIKDVSKAFPGVKALDRVSLEVAGGVVHGIVGENGAGKSTLMKILSGVYEKDSGEITFEGRQIDRITPIESMHMGLAIIYQELNLVNTMTVLSVSFSSSTVLRILPILASKRWSIAA